MIANYFGEEDPAACNICDSCLKKKSLALNKEEFNDIHQRILQLLEGPELQATELPGRLHGVHKEKLKQVINFLQAEKKLVIDKDGFVRTS